MSIVSSASNSRSSDSNVMDVTVRSPVVSRPGSRASRDLSHFKPEHPECASCQGLDKFLDG